MPRKIRVGFIGSGGIAHGKHVPGHLSIPNVELIACCDTDGDRARAFGEKNSIPHVFTDQDEMLAIEELDAVSVCTPNQFHAGPSIAALNAGKHVLCEKPIAGTAADGRRMADAAKKSGKVLQIGLQSRFSPHFWTLRKRIEEGLIGTPYYGRTTAVRRRGIPPAVTFIKKEISGGGCLIDIGVHSFDLMLSLIGYPDPVEVFGAAYTKFADDPTIFTAGWGAWNPDDFDVEDFAVGQVKFANGMTVTIETAWASHAAEIGTDFILGDEAGVSLRDPVRVFADQGKTGFKEYDLKPLRRTPTEFGSFHKAVREDLPSPVPAEEVVKLAEIFDAIYKSAELGHSIKLR